MVLAPTWPVSWAVVLEALETVRWQVQGVMWSMRCNAWGYKRKQSRLSDNTYPIIPLIISRSVMRGGNNPFSTWSVRKFINEWKQNSMLMKKLRNRPLLRAEIPRKKIVRGNYVTRRNNRRGDRDRSEKLQQRRTTSIKVWSILTVEGAKRSTVTLTSIWRICTTIWRLTR